ncbi:hypothetical protein A2688_04490 [Candidatus Daviesbacteria bacterium RIFCSPHIGHO2_01_FULL_38_8]|nr:MAG: hypothetical protein A2688_04490 [Candidatus Daviesbacteria bacterium RIFCSPHIGHO2_01_FULL_38_8]
MNLWQSYLNLYASLPDRCEKSLGLISEPVDSLSSIVFFISAFFIYKLLKNNNIQDQRIKLLVILVVLIGIGSTTYHSFHSPYTAIFDLLPIYIFVFYSLYLLAAFISESKILQYGIPLLLFIFQLGFRFASIPLFILGMPTFHIFNIIFILGLSFWLYSRIGKVIVSIFPVLFSYSLGVLARYFDLIVCPINGVGTHFIWHICVAFATCYTAKFFVKLLSVKSGL